MSEIGTDRKIFDEIEKVHEELQELVDKAQSDTSSQDQYERINYMMEIIDDQLHHGTLQLILDQVHLLSKETYSVKSHIGLIIYYESVASYLNNILVKSFLVRYQQIVHKDVRYLKMQAPGKDFFHQICDTAEASIANIIPVQGKLNDQQKYANLLIKEIMDYRLLTLSDEAAWDFAAQSILSEINAIPS